MVVGCHQQPTIVASFFDNVKGLQMLHQQLSLTLTWQPSSLTMAAIFFDNGSYIFGNIPTVLSKKTWISIRKRYRGHLL